MPLSLAWKLAKRHASVIASSRSKMHRLMFKGPLSIVLKSATSFMRALQTVMVELRVDRKKLFSFSELLCLSCSEIV